MLSPIALECIIDSRIRIPMQLRRSNKFITMRLGTIWISITLILRRRLLQLSADIRDGLPGEMDKKRESKRYSIIQNLEWG